MFCSFFSLAYSLLLGGGLNEDDKRKVPFEMTLRKNFNRFSQIRMPEARCAIP